MEGYNATVKFLSRATALQVLEARALQAGRPSPTRRSMPGALRGGGLGQPLGRAETLEALRVAVAALNLTPIPEG